MINAPAGFVNHTFKILVLLKHAQVIKTLHRTSVDVDTTLHLISRDFPYCQLTSSVVNDLL